MEAETNISESGAYEWKWMRSSNLIVQIRGQLLAYLANGSLEAGGPTASRA